MTWIRRAVSLALAASVTVTPLFAQQTHVLEPSELRALVEAQDARRDGNREVVARVLQRPRVQQVAERLGVNVVRVQQALMTLDHNEMQTLADQARQVESELAGGQSVTLSTTFIIIALLVVILIIVAVD